MNDYGTIFGGTLTWKAWPSFSKIRQTYQTAFTVIRVRFRIFLLCNYCFIIVFFKNL